MGQLVFGRVPQPLGEDVVAPRAYPIHADGVAAQLVE